MTESAPPVVVDSRQGKSLHAFGDVLTVVLSGENTGGRLTSMLAETPPGSGPPPHWHDDEDEWFYVFEGSVEFLLEGEWRPVAPGSMVFAPRGSVHAFRNTGETPLKMQISMSPSGFETFFERCAEVFAEPGPPDMPRIIQIAAEHGIHFVEEG